MTPTDDSRRPKVRRVALRILIDAEESRTFIDDLLMQQIDEFASRDRHLLQELVYGSVRHRNTLEHIVDFHLRNPVARQRPAVAWALRLAAYQLIYLDRIPVHAAVHQTIEAAKGLEGFGSGEVGFVNAVLHKLSNEIRKKTREAPLEDDDPTVVPSREGFCHFARPVLPLRRLDLVAHLALKLSHPHWLVQRWIGRYGEEETRKLLTENNKTPALTARITQKSPSREELIESLKAEGWTVEPGPLDNSISILKSATIPQSPSFVKGWFQIQDVTAIQVGEALKPPAGAKVLDLCSAPGGKAAQLLEAVGPEGEVLAADRGEERLSRVRETLERYGGNFRTVVVPEDPEAIQLEETFTHVLVDAPCSNTGVLARRPEARWRIRSQDLESLSKLQEGLLEAAIRHTAPGGRVVYATCSIEPDENENVVARIFARHDDLEETSTRLFLPHRAPGDGGFYSVLLRRRGPS